MPVLDGGWSRQAGLAGSGHVAFDQRIDTDMRMAVHEIEDQSHQCLTGPPLPLIVIMLRQVAPSGLSDMLDMIAEKIGIASYLGIIISLEQRCVSISSPPDGSAESSEKESAPQQPSVGEASCYISLASHIAALQLSFRISLLIGWTCTNARPWTRASTLDVGWACERKSSL